jgi:hypothetical protein
MDHVTEALLRDLEASPTDLKKLVVSALWGKRSAIAIESDAIARWERDDPHRWASVQEWLLSKGITITVLRSRSAGGNPGATHPAPWPPPSASGQYG